MLELNVYKLQQISQAKRDAAAIRAINIALTTSSREIRLQHCAAYVALVKAGAMPQKNGDLLLKGDMAITKFLGKKDPILLATLAIETAAREKLAADYLAGKDLHLVSA